MKYNTFLNWMVVKFKVFIIKLFKATKTEGLNTTKSPETTDFK